jgi:hypothetical protein
MRSVEQQEKMIQQARDNQWTVGIAILNSGLRVSDQRICSVLFSVTVEKMP